MKRVSAYLATRRRAPTNSDKQRFHQGSRNVRNNLNTDQSGDAAVTRRDLMRRYGTGLLGAA